MLRQWARTRALRCCHEGDRWFIGQFFPCRANGGGGYGEKSVNGSGLVHKNRTISVSEDRQVMRADKSGGPTGVLGADDDELKCTDEPLEIPGRAQAGRSNFDLHIRISM